MTHIKFKSNEVIRSFEFVLPEGRKRIPWISKFCIKAVRSALSQAVAIKLAVGLQPLVIGEGKIP